jgi:hypothetical protein
MVLRTMLVDAIDAAAETIFQRLEASTAQMPATQIRVLGGAMAGGPNEATAFADRGLMVNVAALTGIRPSVPHTRHGPTGSPRRCNAVPRART